MSSQKSNDVIIYLASLAIISIIAFTSLFSPPPSPVSLDTPIQPIYDRYTLNGLVNTSSKPLVNVGDNQELFRERTSGYINYTIHAIYEDNPGENSVQIQHYAELEEAIYLYSYPVSTTPVISFNIVDSNSDIRLTSLESLIRYRHPYPLVQLIGIGFLILDLSIVAELIKILLS